MNDENMYDAEGICNQPKVIDSKDHVTSTTKRLFMARIIPTQLMAFVPKTPILVCIGCCLVVLVQVVMAQYSCGSAPIGCQPQYTLQVSNGSGSMANMIQSAVKLISYLAKDFSVAEDKNVRYVIADTLSETNVFLFNYGGFCRTNIETNIRNCTSLPKSMDFLKSMIMDFGVQLKKITQVKDLGQFVDGLTSTYVSFTRRTIPKTVEKIERLVRVLDWLNSMIVVLSVALIVLYVFWVRRTVIAVLLALAFLHVLKIYVEAIFIYLVHEKAANMMFVRPGSGFFMVLVDFAIVLAQLVYVLMEKSKKLHVN